MSAARLRRPAACAAIAAALVGATAVVEATAGPARPPAQSTAASRGRALFVADCASCHALRAAHARGTAGPNLDRLFRRTRKAKVRPIVLRAIVRGDGAMPAGILGRRDAGTVAAYVARVTGRR